MKVNVTVCDLITMGLAEDYATCENGDEREQFINEAISAAIVVYGQAKKAGFLTDDGFSLREEVRI